MEPHGEQTEAAPTVEQYPSAQFAKVVAAVRDLQHPPQIGPYVIQELIGEGGMGSVYKAEQRQPIRRVVAVKVVKLGMDTREVVARFESERQALALMDHPNVAKVLDAGATDTGRPYFVMEYVKGEPITAFADRHKLTVRQRLELFTQACAAIQHAHQKAIIHRDLKPSNILVTVVDNQPVVKVIDFGVAKAVSQRLTERTLFTETGQLVGTPEYMAPEQAEGGALLDVDTRSDVYSLGVILYELLTGALPFEAKTLRSAGYNEIQRIIREVDPPRPSTRLSKLGKGGHEVARLRQTPLDSLERQLKSELEWIPLKAMHKDRSRRYASTIELSEDIGNYLANKPLRAAPDSTAYRLRKFLRRNKTGVAASAAMVFLLLAGIATTTWQAVRAQDQKRRAELANANTQAVNEFLTQDLLQSADPAVARGRELTVKQALDVAAERVGEKFKDAPAIEAAVRAALASTYDALGEPALALPHARAALAARGRALGEDHPDTISDAVRLAQVLESSGDYEQAHALASQALERARRTMGTRNDETITAMGVVAATLHRQSRLLDAERLYREAVEASRAFNGPRHPRTLVDEHNLASVLADQGRYDEAIPVFRRVLEVSREVNGPDHVDLINTKTNLAMALLETDGADEAARLCREALEANRRVLKDEHPRTLQSMRNLAMTLDRGGKPAEAEALFREALELTRRLQGDDHPETLGAISQLAGVLRRKGDLEGSLALQRESLERCRKVLGDDHAHTIFALNNVGQALTSMARHAEAEPLFAEAYRRSPSAQIDAKRQAIIMSRWGPCMVELGRHAEAEAPLLEAHRRLSETGQTDNAIMTNVLDGLVKAYENTNRADEAARWRARLAAIATTRPATSPARPAR